ncbi:TPA_asm: hypothetical protein, partial [ssRNA phage AIN003]
LDIRELGMDRSVVYAILLFFAFAIDRLVPFLPLK